MGGVARPVRAGGPARVRPAGHRARQGRRRRRGARADRRRHRHRRGQGRRGHPRRDRLAAAPRPHPPRRAGARRQVRAARLRRVRPAVGFARPGAVGAPAGAAAHRAARGLRLAGVPPLVGGRPHRARRAGRRRVRGAAPPGHPEPDGRRRRPRHPGGGALRARPAPARRGGPLPGARRRCGPGDRGAVDDPLRRAAAAPHRGALRGGQRQDVPGVRAGAAALAAGPASGTAITGSRPTWTGRARSGGASSGRSTSGSSTTWGCAGVRTRPRSRPPTTRSSTPTTCPRR